MLHTYIIKVLSVQKRHVETVASQVHDGKYCIYITIIIK